MTDARHILLDRVEAQIAALLPPDMSITRVGSIHKGYDDGVTIACGESKSTVIVWAYGLGEMPDIEARTISLTRHLQAAEEIRLAGLRARDESFAWFYRDEVK